MRAQSPDSSLERRPDVALSLRPGGTPDRMTDRDRSRWNQVPD